MRKLKWLVAAVACLGAVFFMQIKTEAEPEEPIIAVTIGEDKIYSDTSKPYYVNNEGWGNVDGNYNLYYNSKTKTLIFNNFFYDGDADKGVTINSKAIETIEFKGANEISLNGDKDADRIALEITNSEAVTISGSGSLTATAESTVLSEGDEYDSYGIKSEAPLTITGCKITATAGEANKINYGIYSESSLTITGGEVIANGGSATSVTPTASYGVFCLGNLEVKGNASLDATAGKAKTQSAGISCDNSGNNSTLSHIYLGENGSTEKPTINATGGESENSSIAIAICNCNITVYNGTLTANADSACLGSIGISSTVINNKSIASISVLGGTLTANGYEAKKSFGVMLNNVCFVADNDSTIIMTGGKPSAMSEYTIDECDGFYSTGVNGDMTLSGNARVTGNANGAVENCGVCVSGKISLSDSSKLSANSGTEVGRIIAESNIGVFCNGDLNVNDNSVIDAIADKAKQISAGIFCGNQDDQGSLSHFYLGEEGSTKNPTITATAGNGIGDDGPQSLGIFLDNCDMTVYNGTLTANAGSSNGLSFGFVSSNSNNGLNINISVLGGTFIANGYEANFSCGVKCDGVSFTADNNCTLIISGHKAIDASGLSFGSADPQWYMYRTTKGGNYILNTAYTQNNDDKYLEIRAAGDVYTITNTLTNLTSDNTATQRAASENVDYTATFTAASGYNLPTSVNVKVGGTALATSDFTYSNGVLEIPAAKFTGNLEIIAAGVEKPLETTISSVPSSPSETPAETTTVPITTPTEVTPKPEEIVVISSEGKTVNELVEEIKAIADSGKSIMIEADETALANADVLISAIKGKNVNLTIDCKNYSWTVNGSDITGDIADLDLRVSFNTQNIPSEKENELTNDADFALEFTIEYNGEFGFVAELALNVDPKYAGKTATLYYYNEESGEFEVIADAVVDENGVVKAKMGHASDYILVLSEKAATSTGENPSTGRTLTGVAAMVVIAVTVVVVTAKKRSK